MAQGTNSYHDNDIIISVSGKDQSTGFRYVLPAPRLPKDLDPAIATAAMSGWYREAITPAQNEAAKAAKAGKDVREAVTAFLHGFKPSPDRELPTVAAKRVEIAKKLLAVALAERGKSSSEENVNANLAPFMKGRAAEVEAALQAFLAEPYAVTKRGSGAATGGGTAGETLDW